MLTLDGVTVAYPAFQLGPIDLTVGREVLAVLGPSGCGKTTLLAAIAGTTPPDAGHLYWADTPLDAVPVEARRAALVFQESAVFPHMTARANIAYAAAGADQVERMADLLEIADVLDQPADTLSGGERRRVEVARALAAAPRVLLLDEPTTGLDAPIKRRLRDQLRTVLTGFDIPVLYVTHDQREAAAVADRIAVMEAGTIHQVAPPTTLFNAPATPFVASFTGNDNVFPARVLPPDPHPRVAWNGHVVRVADHDFAPGTAVWLCVRPEQVSVLADGEGGPARANVLPAALQHSVYEGGTYTLTLEVGADGASSRLEARMLPPALRRLDRQPPASVHIRLDAAAVHLMPRTDAASARGR